MTSFPRRLISQGPSLLAVALLALAPACGKSTIRSFEGIACSTNSSEDPQRVCSPTADLVCIATFTVMVQDMEEARKWDGGVRPVYVCRLACDLDSDCTQGGDVCCPGGIHGKTYGKMAACVPRQDCHALVAGDGGADGATDGAADGPSSDGGAPDDAGPDASDGMLPLEGGVSVDAPSAEVSDSL